MSASPWTWIALIAVGFGGGFPLSKALLDSGIDVWQFFVPRYVIGSVIIAFVVRRGLGDAHVRNRGFLLGAVNVAAPTIFLTFTTDLLPASVAGILVSFIPITTIAFAHSLVPGERFEAVRLPGIAIAITGVVILVLGSRSADGSALSIAGLAAGAAGIATAGIGGALNRRYAMNHGALDLVTSQFLAATVVVGVVSAPFGGFDLAGFDGVQWLGIVLMGVFSTAIPFFAILKAAELASAATVANSGYLVPVVAATGSVVFLGDPLTLGFVAGSTLILIGVWTSDRAGRRHPRAIPRI